MYPFHSFHPGKYHLKLLAAFIVAGFFAWTESDAKALVMGPPCDQGSPVTVISTVTVCAGVTMADIPVKVTSFNNVGSMSLKLAYSPASLGVPELLSSHPDLWSNFVVNTSVSGSITISGYGAGLTLDDHSTLFTLRFTAVSGLESGNITFEENVQGTFCEYASGLPPDYTPFCDVPMEDYYIPGAIIVNPVLSAAVNSVTHVTSYMNNDGTAGATAGGGTPAYVYLWTNGQTLSALTGLSAGNYTVTVTDANGCTASASAMITQPATICMNIKVFLQGAYNPVNHLMHDSLRVNHYIPDTEPYSSDEFNQYYIHTGGGGGETVTSASIFNVTGPNAIVDWVFLELRDRLDNTVVIHTRSALLQRDGDVTDVDGVSPVCLTNPGDNYYYLAVRHRNHLGVMTAEAMYLSSQGTTVNFTDGSVTEFNWGTGHPAHPGINYSGLSQSTPETGRRAMWAGDANGDRRVIYEAQSDDQSIILSDVNFNTGNISVQCGYNNCIGYYKGDLNLSGKAKYETPDDDRSIVLYQIIFYPLNNTYQAAYNSMVEQLPLP